MDYLPAPLLLYLLLSALYFIIIYRARSLLLSYLRRNGMWLIHLYIVHNAYL